MNIKQASKLLDKSEKTIRRYIKEGKLKAKKVPYKTGPFTWHINEESIKILKGHRRILRSHRDSKTWGPCRAVPFSLSQA